MHVIGRESLTNRVADDMKAAKAVQAARCDDPDRPLAILMEGADRIAGKSVCASEMIDGPSANPINAVPLGTKPDRLIAVDEQRRHFDPTGVESGHDVVRDRLISETREPETAAGAADPDPDRSIGRARERRDARQAARCIELFLQIGLRRGRVPATEGVRATEPQIAVLVAERRDAVQTRNPVRRTKAATAA